MKYPKKETDDGPHPSQESRNWHTDDQFLRAKGYVIHSRPKNGEAIWMEEGMKLPQSLALEIIRREQ